MPIEDLVPRLRELGRIRTGNQVAAGNGRKRPNKLDTFRLTSPSEALIAAAQAAYGGERQPWQSPAGAQWELVTERDRIPIVIPSGESLSQWYELWSGGGCQRRCDGRTEMLSDQPCLCPRDPAERRDLAQKGQACNYVTRLNVVLPDIPDLGVWRLESHGYYAAVELAGAAQFLSAATSAGMNIPAFLRLEQREKKVPGKPTNRYAVPIIEFTSTRIADLIDAGAGPRMLGEPQPVQQLAPGALVPPKAARAKQPKVERPALGPAPAVPSGEGFGRQQPVAPTAPPPAATATDEPDTVAGWVVEDDTVTDRSGAMAEPEVASTSAPAEEPAAAAPADATEPSAPPAELTQEQLFAALDERGINREYAAEVAKAKWPDTGRANPLTPAMRAELLAELTAPEPVTAGL